MRKSKRFTYCITFKSTQMSECKKRVFPARVQERRADATRTPLSHSRRKVRVCVCDDDDLNEHDEDDDDDARE